VTYYLDFYQEKMHVDAADITKTFNPEKEDLTSYDKGSLVVISSQNAPNTSDNSQGSFERIEVVREPDGRESFYIFYSTK
jgi:hypothetical protein